MENPIEPAASTEPAAPATRWRHRLSRRLRRTLIVGTSAAALAAAGLFGIGGLGSAQASHCPSYAKKWVHKHCLSGKYTVSRKTRTHPDGSWERVALRVGKFRGRTYAFALFTCTYEYNGNIYPCRKYDFDWGDAGGQKIQIDGNSWGYNYGQQTRLIRSKYSRYTKALRSTSRSDVRFRGCTWWWNNFQKRREDKFCTAYW